MSEKKLALASRIARLEGVLDSTRGNRKDLSLFRSSAGDPQRRDPSLSLLESLESALLLGETHYTVRPGIPELRRMIASALQARGGPVPDAEDEADNVLITTSETEALYVILLGLGLESGEILGDASAPCPHRALLSLRRLTTAPSWTSEVRAIYRPFHLADPDHARLLAAASKANLPDILDMGSHWLPELPQCDPERTLIIGNLNGIKDLSLFQVGYLMGPRALMARCRSWKQAFSICTAAPSQRAAILRLSEAGS